jgi:hypothetical protein
MSPEVATQLADHHARIEAVENSQERIEGKLDKLIFGVFFALLGIVVQIILKVKP